MMEIQDNQVVRDFTIKNKFGLHARAASLFVQLTNRFSCDIAVLKNGQEVNGKSIMGILILAAAQGSVITVKASGPDAQSAVDSIGGLIEERFGEE